MKHHYLNYRALVFINWFHRRACRCESTRAGKKGGKSQLFRRGGDGINAGPQKCGSQLHVLSRKKSCQCVQLLFDRNEIGSHFTSIVIEVFDDTALAVEQEKEAALSFLRSAINACTTVRACSQN